jgi:hypothetical protein
MASIIADFRRRLAPVSLGIWPALSNPAWNSAAALGVFPGGLPVALHPARVAVKIETQAATGLKRRFLVDGLGGLPVTPVTALYTYRDMEDIARYGADWRATRLGQWLLACLAAGRPQLVRGAMITTEAEIAAYYHGYLKMFESMRTDGYRYDGDDHMCFGITAEGGVVLVRRGTHRIAAAHILGLSQVTGRVTHIDRRFAEAAVRKHRRLGVIPALQAAVIAATRSDAGLPRTENGCAPDAEAVHPC